MTAFCEPSAAGAFPHIATPIRQQVRSLRATKALLACRAQVDAGYPGPFMVLEAVEAITDPVELDVDFDFDVLDDDWWAEE